MNKEKIRQKKEHLNNIYSILKNPKYSDLEKINLCYAAAKEYENKI